MTTSRTGENKVINKFLQKYRKNRAFKHLEELTGIDIEAQSQKNILAIYHRLKTNSALPDEIKQNINKEKIRETDVLTPTELIFYQSLLSIPLIGNHATLNKDIITSKSLYSSKELERRHIKVPTRTSKNYGEDDFIFFSYSLPEKKEIVSFINMPGIYIIYVNLDQLMQKDPLTYSHMWTSGHFYAYDQETVFSPVSYESKKSATEVNVFNQVSMDNGFQYQRKFVFSQSNQKIQQELTRENEISAGRHIKPFHMLRLIEFIRYLDPKTRNHILKQYNNREKIAELFYSVFTPGKAELHIPVSLTMASLIKTPTDEKSIPREDPLYSWDQMSAKNLTEKKVEELFENVIKGNHEKIIETIIQEPAWKDFTATYKNGKEYFSLLNVAVLEKQHDIVKTLLCYGADPNANYWNEAQFDSRFNAERHALQDAIEIKDFTLIKLLTGKFKIKPDFYNIKMIGAVRDIDMYTAIAFDVDLNIFEYLYQRYHIVVLGEREDLLMIAILYDNTKILSYLLENKVNPNSTQRIHVNADDGHLVPLGMISSNTPLSLAVELGRVTATQILLENKADPNVVIKDSGSVYKFGKGLSPMQVLEDALQNPDKDWFESYLESKQTKLRFGELVLPEKEALLKIKKLLLGAGANPEYKAIKSLKFECFKHEVYAFISGVNIKNEPFVLLAEKSLSEEIHVVIPGGRVNYEIDINGSSALKKLMHAIIHLELDEMKLLSVNKLHDAKKDTLIEISHYRLNKSIEEFKLPKRTYNSQYMELKFNQSLLSVKNIQFVPLNQIKMNIVEYDSIPFPVFTFNEKVLPCAAALPMAELLGIKKLDSDKAKKLFFEVHNNPRQLFHTEIKNNSIDNIKTFIKCKIHLYGEDYNYLILKALELQHYNIVDELLTIPFALKPDIFYHFFNLEIMDTEQLKKIPPEEIVVKLFDRCIDKIEYMYRGWPAKYAGFAGFFTLLERIAEINIRLLYDAAEAAAIYNNLTSLKWIFQKISHDEKPSVIKKVLANKLQFNIVEFLLDEYEGDEPASKTLLSKMVEKYCEVAKLKDHELEAAYLVLIKRLIDNDYQDGYHMVWNSCSQLQRKKLYAQAGLLLKIIRNSPVLALQYASKIESMDEIDRIILLYAEHPLIKENFLADENFLGEKFNIYFQRAILNNAVVIVKFILENGFNHRHFDIDLPDQDGFTPLSHARRLGFTKIAKLLVANGAKDFETESKKSDLMTLINECELKKPSTNILSQTKIILFSEQPLLEDSQAKTGDEDYVSQLQLTMNLSEAKPIVCRNIALSDSENKNAILHLMINAPHMGCTMDEKRLNHLKEIGCRVVVTAIEFAKHRDAEYKKQTMIYLKYADKVIFLDESDQKNALQFAKSQYPFLVEKITQSTVIPVPPTISAQHIAQEKTSSDIMCFGMIRAGKGFAHVRRLAKLIKESKDPSVNGKTIFIVGSVQKHKTRRNNTAYDATLYDLLCALYPDRKKEFYHKTPSELAIIFNQLQSKKIEPDLPIRLFLDVDESKLTALFQQCEYAFYPAYRGATLRNSSISTELAFGCIIYSHTSDITPPCLLKDGEFRQSMVLFDNDDYDIYSQNVLADMSRRERNKLLTDKFDKSLTLNDKNRKMVNRLLETMLSPKEIAQKHLEFYASLPKPILKKESEDTSWFKLFKKKPKGEKETEVESSQKLKSTVKLG